MRAYAVNFQDMFLDLAWKHIDPAQDNQIIAASGDLVHAAHAACRSRAQRRQVPSAVADDGKGFLGQ